MRVIAGEAKGRRLKSPRGTGTRPILDRVKVALFDVLSPWVEDARVLDLFAGAGSVGIEALSRGARNAVFVELNPGAVATIKANLETTRLADRAKVVRRDVFRFLEEATGDFDLIYVAPPQYVGLVVKTLEALDRRPLLAPGGRIIAQQHPKERVSITLTQLKLADERRYGDTELLFFERLS